MIKTKSIKSYGSRDLNTVFRILSRNPLSLFPSSLFDNMVVSWHVQSSSNLETIYTIIVDPEAKTIICNCAGFLSHGRCRHVKFYKTLIRAILHEKPR